ARRLAAHRAPAAPVSGRHRRRGGHTPGGPAARRRVRPRCPLALTTAVVTNPGSRADLGDGALSRTAGSDDRGRGESGPVAIAEQMQTWLLDAAGALGGDASTAAAQVQRVQMPQGKPEPRAPDDRVGSAFGAISPG